MAREVLDQSIEGSCEGHKDVAITGPGARVGACSIWKLSKLSINTLLHDSLSRV